MSRIRGLTPGNIRGALWAWRAGSAARRQLTTRGLEAVALPRPPALDRAGARGVDAILRRRKLSCLERSLVRQRWYAAHGSMRDLIIGVTDNLEDFGAHAWLDGDDERQAEGFVQLLRRPAAPAR
jgi:hypothetical protein